MIPEPEIVNFRSTRERTRSLVASLSEEEMADRPGPERWSCGELLDHLLRTECLWRGEIEELVGLLRTGRQPFLSRLWTDFPFPVVGVLPAPLLSLLSIPLTAFNTFVPRRVFLEFLGQRAFKARAPAVLSPRRGRTAEDLRRELKTECVATIAVFEDNDDLRFDRMIYQHPLLGVVDAVDLLQVLTAHERRHQDQLREILAKLGVRGRA